MRWLMILLLVSLVGLLIAAAGVARHIWLHARKLRLEPPSDTGTFLAPALSAAKEPDGRTKI
jgi:hypothetical protein